MGRDARSQPTNDRLVELLDFDNPGLGAGREHLIPSSRVELSSSRRGMNMPRACHLCHEARRYLALQLRPPCPGRRRPIRLNHTDGARNHANQPASGRPAMGGSPHALWPRAPGSRRAYDARPAASRPREPPPAPDRSARGRPARYRRAGEPVGDRVPRERKTPARSGGRRPDSPPVRPTRARPAGRGQMRRKPDRCTRRRASVGEDVAVEDR
jgi:hypothetical protein